MFIFISIESYLLKENFINNKFVFIFKLTLCQIFEELKKEILIHF
jgi:hypothetical protein